MSAPVADPKLTFALALLAGMVSHALARHLRIPGIVLLLIAGVALGPDGSPGSCRESLARAFI